MDLPLSQPSSFNECKECNSSEPAESMIVFGICKQSWHSKCYDRQWGIEIVDTEPTKLVQLIDEQVLCRKKGNLVNWFENKVSTHFVLNDLFFYKRLLNYDQQVIRAVFLKSFNNHLNYLTSNLSTFTLFDERIESKDKEIMFRKLINNHVHIVKVTQVTQLMSFNPVCGAINSFGLLKIISMLIIFVVRKKIIQKIKHLKVL